MTNIEAYRGKRERTRVQNNFPSGAPFRRYHEQLYLAPGYPEPGLSCCEAYEPEHLSVKSGEMVFYQGILDEDPSLDPRVIRIRQLVKRKNSLREEIRQLLSNEYNRLVKLCQVRKDYWHAGPWKSRWRKPWYQKVWTGWRYVMAKQYLKPRVIAYRAIKGFDSRGQKIYEIRRKTITPYRWVEKRKPKFTKILRKPSGLSWYKPRVCTKRIVTDWDQVRRRFAAYKFSILDKRLALLNIRQQLNQLRRTLTYYPKLACSWTQSGFAKPPTITLPLVIPRQSSPYFDVESGLNRKVWPGRYVGGHLYQTAYMYANEAWAYGETLEQCRAMMEQRAYSDVVTDVRPVLQSEECAMGLGDRMRCTLDADSYDLHKKAVVREENIFRSYATLAGLTKASDYVFQPFRSLGELKDTGATVKQARDFLRWLKSPSFRRLTPKKIYSSVAAAYLAWKFAIEPTIQDAQTVLDNTVDYLTDIRRSLQQLVQGLQAGSCIYHARSAYASSGGIISARRLLHADNRSFGEFQYSLSWTRYRRSPFQVPLSYYGYGTQDTSDITISVVDDPHHRGAQLVRFEHSGISGTEVSYSVEDISDVGFCLRSEMTQHDWAGRDHCYPSMAHTPEEIASFARNVQNAHQLRLPYDVRDVASGVLFASYHVEDLLRLASNGSLDLNTIQTYVDQLRTVESWLSSAGAQQAAGKELFRHMDLPYVAWQLTPLSFLYDWFTTSGIIVEGLNTLARADHEVIPQPMFGIWQSERHELLSCIPALRMKSLRCKELVRDWTIAEVTREGQGSYFLAAPSRSTIFNDYVWEPPDGTAVFNRTGLYRFRRGEYQPSAEIHSYLPKFKLDLDRGKLVTLAAMLGGFLNH